MRIGHFYDAYEMPGGVPTECQLLTKSMVHLGHEVFVYTFKDLPGPYDTDIINRIAIRRFNKKVKIPFLIPKELINMLRNNSDNIDILHIHGGYIPDNVSVARVAIKAGIPYVVTPYGQLNQPYLIKKGKIKKLLYIKFFFKKVLKNAISVHALSEKELLFLSKHVSKENIFVAPLGLWPGVPDHVDSNYFSKINPLLSGKRKLVYLGRMDWHLKGLDILIRGLSLIMNHSKDFNLCLIIIGPDWKGGRAKIEKLANRLNISEYVFFTGYIPEQNKYDALASGDLLIMPSRWEGFPRAVREVVAIGRPVIVTEGTNIAEWVRKYGAGLVVAPYPQSIAQEVINLFNDNEKIKEMREGAKKLSTQEFDWVKIAKTICDKYSE
jgi:glycosyltransferase involved in cell wall biosynthesis